MAFDFGEALLGAAVTWGAMGTLDKASEDESGDAQTDSGTSEGQTTLMERRTNETVDTDVERELARMNDRQARNEPPANSMHGFVGLPINDLSPGASATVRITPTSGHNLDTDRLEFTNEADHSYVLEIEGNTVAETHVFKSKPPRTVHHGNPIICKVTNNTDASGVSDRTTDLDFEAQAWGWATEQGRGGLR